MERTGEDVSALIQTVTPAVRRRDAETLVELMRDVTGLEPEVWTGRSIGFGEYTYEYASGRGGSAGAAGFAPRKASMVVYFPDGISRYEEALTRLGTHTTGVVCLYLKNLDDVDLSVLREIVSESFQRVTAGTYTERAERRFNAPSETPPEA